MLGSATFTTLASSTTMNWATATTASTALALTRTGRAPAPGVMLMSVIALEDRPDPGEPSSPDGGDSPELEQLEAERFDLRDDAEQRGPVLDQAREHRLAALQLARHRWERRQGGLSESAPYPDRVQARRCGHASTLAPGPVSRRRWNPVIVLRSARSRGAAAPVRATRRRSGCAHRASRRCCGRGCSPC